MYKKLNPNGDLINLESGGGISIPQLYFDAGYTLSGISKSEDYTYIQENLRFWWTSSDMEFLNHNPRIFLFQVRKRRKKASPGSPTTHRSFRNGYTHPTHKRNSGIYNNPNYKAFYNNGIQYNAFNLDGMSTEFPLSLTSTTKTIVEIDPNDWFRNDAAGGSPTLIQPTNYSTTSSTNYKTYGAIEAETKWVTLAFAIAIDNPNFTFTNKQNPVIFGPITNTVRFGFKDDPLGPGGAGQFGRFGFVGNKSLLKRIV